MVRQDTAISDFSCVAGHQGIISFCVYGQLAHIYARAALLQVQKRWDTNKTGVNSIGLVGATAEIT